MTSIKKSTPWKKSRKYGDIYGGRQRLRLADNIFKRAHSLNRPSEFDNLPILIEDNPSREFFFPISAEEAQGALEALPEEDSNGITHIWLRRVKKSDYTTGEMPLAEFICGSGVRLVILYPIPKDLNMVLGAKKPSQKFIKELTNARAQINLHEGVWVAKWERESLKAWYINKVLYHEIGHHIDWYSRHWSKANRKKVEEFADQYAVQKTATATHIINFLEEKSEN